MNNHNEKILFCINTYIIIVCEYWADDKVRKISKKIVSKF